ncbi:DUF4172 domain-containing protein [Extensimonas sp. H3M7-6]|uniref:DUF4172 domain-containing protein n=1 Tax=Extensimonas soli TaxID=3031322 RepID=UPI00387E41B0
MKSGDYRYIWQASDWPNWRFDLAALAAPMAEVSRAQGVLLGRLADVGMALRDQASLAALTEDVVKTSEIEGEQLNVESVRSSIARRLGVDIGALGACRTLGVDSENAPRRDQFLPDSQPHSGAMGQEDGKKWAAAAHSQPTIPKSDGLLV